jgi:hypothetical protein
MSVPVRVSPAAVGAGTAAVAAEPLGRVRAELPVAGELRARDPAGMTGVIAGAGFHCVTRRGIPEGMISYKGDD